MDDAVRRPEPGLALRMRRERRVISAQHRQLDHFYARLAAALDARDAREARDTFRRFGDEAYERMVEPLMTGIYGGDGEQLSLQATFPNLRALELEHGSVLRGLGGQPPPSVRPPPFVGFRAGTAELVAAVVAGLARTRVVTGTATRVAGRVRLNAAMPAKP